jgi:hemolysin activation/secretion protein
MEVELKVKDELPLHGSLEMNSRNTSNTTYARLIGSLRYDNLWQKHHSVSLQYQMSPENTSQVEVVTGTYVMPTGWYDTRLSLYGMSISSNTGVPGVQVGELAVVGSGTVYGLRLLKPLDVSGDDIQSLTVGFDYKSFDTTTTSNTPIAYAKFIAGYDGSWRSDISSTALNLTGNFSFRGLGNDPAQFQNKLDASNLTNPDAGALAANFMYLSGNLKNQLTLPADVLLQSRIRGQASSTFLINNEQFSVGGPLSVRGYHQSQALGDNGLNISMEIYTPKLLMSDWEKLENFRALAFAEWAGIWSRNMGLLPPQNTHFSLASTGLGLRLKMLKSLTGEFDWSYPLLAYQTQTSFVGVGQQRVDFRVLYEF